ncbi:MAG TPA: DUF192 domain-containing protein [Polyangiaceae bacterium]
MNARALVSTVLFAVLLPAAACHNAPPEPDDAPRTTATIPPASAPDGAFTTTSAPTTAPSAAAPCIRPLAKDAPPPVTAAPKDLCPKDPAPSTRFKTGTMTFGDKPLEVELALTDAESERGLMYRMSMPEEHGMLFDLHQTKEQTFWMHNTCIPLDMLFVDTNGVIVGILDNVPVLNDEPRSIGCWSRYVLETNAGWSRRHGVKPGDKVGLPSTSPQKN